MAIIIKGTVKSRAKKETDHGDLIVKYSIDTGGRYRTVNHVNPQEDEILARDSEVEVEVNPSAWVGNNGAMISWYMAKSSVNSMEEF